jgi:hypothetical protein
VTYLPTDNRQLRLIHGIGKVRLTKYGKELCRLIQGFRAQQRKKERETGTAS